MQPHGPALNSLQFSKYFFCIWNPTLDTILSMCSKKPRVMGNDYCVQSAGHASVCTAQDAGRLPCCQGKLFLAMDSVDCRKWTSASSSAPHSCSLTSPTVGWDREWDGKRENCWAEIQRVL